MTAGGSSRRLERTTSARQDSPLPGHFPAAHAEPAAVRARRRRVVTATGIGGAGLLGISLSTKAGSPQFYLLTMGLAGTWAAGALSSGPLPLNMPQGREDARRHPVIMSVLTGAAAFGLFYGTAQLARHIPPLNRAIGSVLRYADDGSTPLVLLTACANAVAEELFFRGALWCSATRWLGTSASRWVGMTGDRKGPADGIGGAWWCSGCRGGVRVVVVSRWRG